MTSVLFCVVGSYLALAVLAAAAAARIGYRAKTPTSNRQIR